jgi:hypothetical protein
MATRTSPVFHVVVNWKSSNDFVLNSIASHCEILKKGSDYVWYGKMIKSNLVKIPKQYYDKLQGQLAEGIPTYLHLYSPDFRDQNVWHIGKIEAIQTTTPTETELVPDHYTRLRYPVHYWFKISDFREFTRGELIPNLIDVNHRPFDIVSIQKYPTVILERKGLEDAFDYRLTNGKKWYEFQKLYSDELRQRVKPRFIFVIMPFSQKFYDVYVHGIKPLEQEFSDLGIIIERADDTINNKAIIKKIRSKIKEAELIVADVSGNNPNVLYELGYAHGLKKNAIILTNNRKRIPFDLNDWTNIAYVSGKTDTIKEGLRKYITSYYSELISFFS